MDPTQFVILYHSGYGPPHYDLMIAQPHMDQQTALATWRLYQDPAQIPNRAIEAERIQDHRSIYLSYEGPISGNRGTVRQQHAGFAIEILRTSTHWQYRIDAAKLNGLLELSLIEHSAWTLTFKPNEGTDGE